ncbi:MAG: LysM peptidoglycan-binding domain-containing protein [Sciscionella sp.]
MAVMVDAGDMRDRRAAMAGGQGAHGHSVRGLRVRGRVVPGRSVRGRRAPGARRVLAVGLAVGAVGEPCSVGGRTPWGATSRSRRDTQSPRVLPSRRVAASACTARPAPRPLHYLVVLALASAAAVMVLAGFGSVARGSTVATVPTMTSVVQVMPGETLWDIARSRVPAVDPAAVVSRIRELNHLGSSGIGVGQPLRVPDGSRSSAG